MQKHILFALLLAVVLAVSVSAAPTQESLTEFAKWVQARDVHSKANLGLFEGYGFGSVAREDIAADDVIISVPLDAAISLQKVKAAYEGVVEFSKVNAFEPLVFWLLAESNNANSDFKAFFSVLPESYPSHPLFWTAEELQELANTGVETVTLNRKAALEASHEHCLNAVKAHPELFKEADFTWERFLWAYVTILSRSWTIEIDGTMDQIMVPLADMVNHAPGGKVGGLSEDKTRFELRAGQDFAKGEQVFTSYGSRNNYDLLSIFGFVVEDNADDYMSLNFNLNPTNLVQGIVEPLLRAVDPAYKSIKIRKDSVPLALLRIFRLNAMDFSELEFVDRALKGAAVSLPNELRAYRAALRSLAGMLQSYPTTIQEDAAILAREDISDNLRAAVIVRQGQKEALRNTILIIGKLWENILVSGKLMGEIPL